MDDPKDWKAADLLVYGVAYLNAKIDALQSGGGFAGLAADRRHLIALAIDCPITWSTEGLDDGCMWCGADAQHHFGRRPEPDERYALHLHDCAWMAARVHLGLPTGRNGLQKAATDV